MLLVSVLVLMLCILASTSNDAPNPGPPGPTRELKSLPGLQGTLPSTTTAGYVPVEVTVENKPVTCFMYYWFVESENKPETDPVTLWVQGGPGGSSVEGALIENGPVMFDLTTGKNDLPGLMLNPFRWSTNSSMLFWESPPGVGFSYCQGKYPTWTDELTAKVNHEFLCNFFETEQPSKVNNDFYIAGESYAGIYIPTVAELIHDDNNRMCRLPPLKGLAIGNGCTGNDWGMSCGPDMTRWTLKVLLDRSMIERDQYDEIFAHCHKKGETILNFQNPSGKCKAAVRAASASVGSWDNYNYRDTCPSGFHTLLDLVCSDGRAQWACSSTPKQPRQYFLRSNGPTPKQEEAQCPIFGANGCIRCDMRFGAPYLQDPLVKKKLGGKITWNSAQQGKTPLFQYTPTLKTTVPILKKLIEKYRIMLYTGDADTEVPYPGYYDLLDNQLKFPEAAPWRPWYITGPTPIVGGYVTEYTIPNVSGLRQLQLVTVKDSGHMVPKYTPAAGFQMFTSFLFNHALPPSPPQQIFALPGFDGNFPSAMYSGYLSAGTGYHMFYWLTESENSPADDPLVLWVQGGPGASGLTGLFTEIGPFRFNMDKSNQTYQELELDPYRWSQKANVLVWESPPEVGFSYCDGDCPAWNATITAELNFEFLCNFFAVFPQYLKNDFYIFGESYGGVYVPTLVEQIDKNKGVCNMAKLKGFAIGNGCTGTGWGSGCGPDMNRFSLEVLVQRSLLPEKLRKKVLDECIDEEGCLNFYSASAGCKSAAITASEAAGMFYNYDIYDSCPGLAMTFLGQICGDAGAKWACTAADTPTHAKYDSNPPTCKEGDVACQQQFAKPTCSSVPGSQPNTGSTGCLRCDAPLLEPYLNRTAVRTALHANIEWGARMAHFNFSLSIWSTLDLVRGFVNKSTGYRALIYSGDADAEVPYPGTFDFMNKLGFNATTSFQPWRLNGTDTAVAGYAMQYDVKTQLTVATVRHAGHMVPHYAPLAGLRLLEAFIAGEDLATKKNAEPKPHQLPTGQGSYNCKRQGRNEDIR